MEESARISSIEPLLHDVYAKTASGDYAEAFVLLDMARSADPENIYFDALKKELGQMFSRERSESLSEEQRREMMESLPGIIECALRDSHRHTHPSPVPAPQPESGTGLTSETSEEENDDAKKELEALKLIYFQRASKFVMKGDYEQALAEVKRVFIVDPESTIAKKYATRVEDLIKHARHLAADPAETTPPVPHATVPPARIPETPRTVVPPARVEQPPAVHAHRSTAWDAAFESPAPPRPISERRNAPPRNKETVAYGDTLEPWLNEVVNPVTQRHNERKPARSRKTATVLGIVIMVLIAGSTFAVLTAGSGSKHDGFAQKTDDAELNAKAAGTVMTQPVLDVQSAQQQSTSPQTQTPPPASTVEKQTAGAPLTTADPEPVAAKDKPKSNDPLPAAPTSLLAASTPEKEEPRMTELKPADSKGTAIDPPTFVPVEKEPQILKLEKAQFADFIWKSVSEGTVVVRVLIDAQGKPVQTQLLKSSNSLFEQPVIDALMKSKFAAGQMGTGPVSAWLTIPFRIKQPK